MTEIARKLYDAYRISKAIRIEWEELGSRERRAWLNVATVVNAQVVKRLSGAWAGSERTVLRKKISPLQKAD